MKDHKSSKKIEQLITPLKNLHVNVEGKEVSLEELESLCSTFDGKSRGCGSFSSVEGSDDLLF